MRSFLSCCMLLLVVSCGGQAAPSASVPIASSATAAAARNEPVQNSTQLRADALVTPGAEASVSFVAPQLGEHVLLADPRSYRVRVVSDARGPEIIGFELALDGERPRRLSLGEPELTLGDLLGAGADLKSGAHWLFAAPLAAAGLVPRGAVGRPRAGKGRRFFIGKTPDELSGPKGAVWLRRPEGTYNGAKNSDSVLFDAFVFSALGDSLDTPATITLQSLAVSGKLALTSPFVLHDVPSGVYEVTASAPAASTSTTQFTVNRELSGGP